MSLRERFNLPGGLSTTSADQYCKAWRSLAKPICKATGSMLYAFDPGLAFVRKDGSTWNLAVHEALLIGRAVSKRKGKVNENS